MSDTGKITINLSVVDPGPIDLLVKAGFYANCTDLIRTAIRNQIALHGDAVKQSVARKDCALGAMGYSRRTMERLRAAYRPSSAPT